MDKKMRLMFRLSIVFVLVFLGGGSVRAQAQTKVVVSGERRIPFNDGWRFSKGDPEGARSSRDSMTPRGAQLQLPHDWAIEGPFDQKYSANSAALPIYGVAWYRKTFTLPEHRQGPLLRIEFDGAMSNAHVWLNGQELGERPYGYIGFAFDLTPHLRFGGQPNVAGRAPGSRGSVVALVSGRGHLPQRLARRHRPAARGALGHVSSRRREVSDAKASVAVRTEIRNRGGRESQDHAADLDPGRRRASPSVRPARRRPFRRAAHRRCPPPWT